MIGADGHFTDQPIVPGADVIYRPKGNAGEYAPLATNPYRGCGHGCAYCYVPPATHIPRPTFDQGAVPRPGFLQRLERDIRRYQAAGISDGHPADQVFITFSSDPFHHGDLSLTRQTMHALKDGGMAFCTLSKGGRRALSFLPEYRHERDAYACTLTTLDDDFSRTWERNAALPGERIAVLEAFHQAGIFTWVSLEPTLDAAASIAIVRATYRFVDLYKIGKANYVPKISKTIDWATYTDDVTRACRELGARHYVKRDLQAFLPPDYDNPLRVPQHHGAVA
ncbi:DNA repair photolyase [Bradyrhizobium elkanii]|uniref:radical SAM protein n=1 Tax=Bradyrhizobium elkanii TaxID=29448 RepID=UPI00091C1F64|nr:radical SAM protein [Bradyrhizobium elkanii]MCW2195116.1 DNA repair photolyase [Bradyrhizobium elkanii]NWL67194.1 hypothetical protein [Bradyrhizobium elkanii]OIM93216.1 hypothetical protein BLN97_17585 [Bradyrhizobium elkanii]